MSELHVLLGNSTPNTEEFSPKQLELLGRLSPITLDGISKLEHWLCTHVSLRSAQFLRNLDSASKAAAAAAIASSLNDLSFFSEQGQKIINSAIGISALLKQMSRQNPLSDSEIVDFTQSLQLHEIINVINAVEGPEKN